MNKTRLIICLTVLFTIPLQAQIITKPNYGLKTPETLEISRIETGSQNTVVYLSIENRIKDGYYCADKNIYIVYSDGTKSKMISSKGIPNCPETYKFNAIGEKLNFSLTFPPVGKGTNWVDLIEECSDNCFSFYGVCLDAAMNRKIDEASVLAENNEPASALISFLKIADTIENKNSGIAGLIYMNIIQLSKETGNIPKASEWYRKLKTSGIPHNDLYIKNLNSQGISY